MLYSNTRFAAYVREVLAHLYDVAPQQREAIAHELYAHLEDMAAERGTSPDDPQLQADIIAQFGASQRVGQAFARAYRAPLAPAWWRTLLHVFVRAEVAALLVVVGVLCGWAAHDMPPPISDVTVTEVSGSFAALDDDCCADTLITLREYQASFYINSDLVPLLDRTHLHQLRPGEPITLTVYRQWEPLRDQRSAVPVVGMRSARGVLLERAAVVPARAYSQPVFASASLGAGGLCLVILVLHISRSAPRRPTMFAE